MNEPVPGEIRKLLDGICRRFRAGESEVTFSIFGVDFTLVFEGSPDCEATLETPLNGALSVYEIDTVSVDSLWEIISQMFAESIHRS